MREIKFRAFDEYNKQMNYKCIVGNNDKLDSKWTCPLIFINGSWMHYDGENIMQFTGLTDSKGKEIFEGDIIEFWLCYETTQTHTGDNIPTGSYTEPDEPQLTKIKGQVCFDEDRLCWSFGVVGNAPYQMQNAFILQHPDNILPIIGRNYYTIEEISYIMGWDEMSEKERLEDFEISGFESEDQMMSVINNIEVIGNIHENPELLK